MKSAEDYLIPNRRPGAVRRGERSDKIIYSTVKTVAARAGVKAHVHSLRAAFAVRFDEVNPDNVIGLREMMGHARIIETLRVLTQEGQSEGDGGSPFSFWGGGHDFVFPPSEVAARKKPPLSRGFFEDSAYGIRTRAAAVRGRCPRPLDECALERRISVARLAAAPVEARTASAPRRAPRRRRRATVHASPLPPARRRARRRAPPRRGPRAASSAERDGARDGRRARSAAIAHRSSSDHAASSPQSSSPAATSGAPLVDARSVRRRARPRTRRRGSTSDHGSSSSMPRTSTNASSTAPIAPSAAMSERDRRLARDRVREHRRRRRAPTRPRALRARGPCVAPECRHLLQRRR